MAEILIFCICFFAIVAPMILYSFGGAIYEKAIKKNPKPFWELFNEF